MAPDSSRAITILTSLRDQLGPQYLSYWVLPNVVLTLSGARAYCDGVFWDDAKQGLLTGWSQEISESVKVIKKSEKVLWSKVGIEEARPGEKYTGYDIIFEIGLQYSLSHTQLLARTSFEQVKNIGSAETLLKVMVDDLKSQVKFKDYSAENLKHVAFGILVGYPDKAIIESVLRWEADNPLSETLIDANIQSADYYVCPQPIYSYPRKFANDPDIRSHEKLWSDLLNQYYASDFHKSLEEDQNFQRKMKELGNLR